MSKTTLKEISVVGSRYINIFKMDDESIVKVETTESNYNQLNDSNHIDPTIENGVWDSSYSVNKYDTDSGYINNGEYVDNIDNYLVKYNDIIFFIDKENITNNEIDSDLLS